MSSPRCVHMESSGVIASLCTPLWVPGDDSSPRYAPLLIPGIDTSRRFLSLLQQHGEAIRGGHKRWAAGLPSSEYRRGGTILLQRKRERDRGRAVVPGQEVPGWVYSLLLFPAPPGYIASCSSLLLLGIHQPCSSRYIHGPAPPGIYCPSCSSRYIGLSCSSRYIGLSCSSFFPV